jgi:hypothetical protein
MIVPASHWPKGSLPIPIIFAVSAEPNPRTIETASDLSAYQPLSRATHMAA